LPLDFGPKVIAMRKLTISLGMCLLLCLSAPAMALDLQEGMHGMPWASSATEFAANLSQVRESGPVAYYIPSGTLYQAAGQTVPTVVYGFYRDRLFAAYIQLGSPVQFANLKRHFSGRYGAPKTEHDADRHLTVLRWKTGDVHIKLKMKDPGDEIKMGVYYLPLAGELNREQLEDIPAELYRETTPGKKREAVAKPLVD
jgi:hypothetical protein